MAGVHESILFFAVIIVIVVIIVVIALIRYHIDKEWHRLKSMAMRRMKLSRLAIAIFAHTFHAFIFSIFSKKKIYPRLVSAIDRNGFVLQFQ